MISAASYATCMHVAVALSQAIANWKLLVVAHHAVNAYAHDIHLSASLVAVLLVPGLDLTGVSISI